MKRKTTRCEQFGEGKIMIVKTQPYDVVNYLETDWDMTAYLEAACEDGNLESLRIALGNVARAKGLLEISKQTGIPRKRLNQAFAPDGKSECATMLKVVRALAKPSVVPGRATIAKTVANVSRHTKRTKRKAS